MKVKFDKIYASFLNWGIVLLAVSMTFSITLMNISFGFLFLAFLILLFKKKIKFDPTGLELPLLIFIGFYLISAIAGPKPLKSIKDVSDNYWYILHMYLVIYLFGSKEIDKFVRILGWSAVAVSVYTILQSTIGLSFNLGFHIGKTVKMVAPRLLKVTDLWGMPIYMGTGITGHHLTFGGQIMMLFFFTYVAMKKKWLTLLVLLALVFSFAYSAWFGFVTAVILFFTFKRKRVLYPLGIAALFIVLLIAVPGNRSKIQDKFSDRVNIWKTALKMYRLHPIAGVGPGQYKRVFDSEYAEKFPGSTRGARCHPHSIYLDILTEGGIFTFLAFIFLLWRFLKLYASPPAVGKWKDLHKACLLALIAVLSAGIFQTYLTDAENSVLIWTLAGLVVRIKKIEDENKRFNIIYSTEDS